MSNEIRKLSYCSDCHKNVPHCRIEASGFGEVLLRLLQVLRIGCWYCLHCQRHRLILSAVRADADDYRFVEPSEPVDPSKPAIWSRSCSGDSESFAATGSSAGGDLKSEHEGLDWVDQFSDSVVETSINGPISVVAQNGTNGEESLATAVMMEPIVTRHEEAQTQSQEGESDETVEFIESESVGNFIKEKSLVLKSTRIHRFTEKYRDALVDRVLAGKVNISSLTADGMYTEAELISWIADKAKRQTKKVETLELDTDPRLKDQRGQAGYGPYGGR